MKITYRDNCHKVDWPAVAEILKVAGMGHHLPDMHKKAFEASHTVIFAYTDHRLIGFGRAISDGQYQAAIYDCAVLPPFQGQGIGSTIIEKIHRRLSHCNIILYASPGKEGFYRKHGFSKMKTGMAWFLDTASKRQRGFIE